MLVGHIDFGDDGDFGYMELQLHARLMDLSDQDLAFVVAMVHAWRDFIRSRELAVKERDQVDLKAAHAD